MYGLYSGLWYLLLPLVFIKLWLRGRKAPAYRLRWRERLGYCGLTSNKPVIWVHAVSVGETIAAVPMIKALQQQYPDMQVLVTSMTPTGSAQVKHLLGDSVLHAYAPYDLPCAVNRFVKRLPIRALIIMETELWPNMLRIAQRHSITVTVANARLSQRSADGYARFARFTKMMLSSIDLIAVQNNSDAERFRALGAQPRQLLTMGSVKFDIDIDTQVRERAQALRQQLGEARPIWIAASTHRGEDETMLQAHQLLQEVYPNALLILVPRHPERFDEVANLIEIMSLPYARRQHNKDATLSESCAVYLADTMGEMLLLYAAADIAVVCGSFIVHGGHNVLEPAALGKPVITGPHNFNFAEIHQCLVAHHALAVVESAPALATQLQQWISQPENAHQVGCAALQQVSANKGAVMRFLQALALMLKA